MDVKNTLKTYADTMKRPLGLSEKLMYKMRDYGGMNCCGIIHIEGNLDKTALQSALSFVVTKNSILNCVTNIVTSQSLNSNASENIVYFNTDNDTKLPLSECLFDNEQELKEAISAKIKAKIPDNQKLWELAIFSIKNQPNSHHLVATFDHTIIDGFSTYMFFTQLLLAYQSASNLSQPIPISSEPAELSTGYKLNIRDALKFFAHEIGKLLHPLTSFTYDKTAHFSERQTKLLKISFTKEQTEQLILKSRENGTTLQGTIVAALFFASAKHACKTNKRYRFCNATPVDLRKDFNINNLLIGNYSSSVETIHTIEQDTSFWSLAREVKQKVTLAKNKNLHLSSLIIFEYLQRFLSEKFRINILNGKPMGRLYSTVVTNLGRLNLDVTLEDISIKSVSAAFGQHGFGANLGVAPITFNNSLSFYLHYITPLTSHEKAVELRDSISSLLLKSLSSDFSYRELNH